MISTPTAWSFDQQENAQAEGWDIFEASGSMQNEDGRSPFQLQKIDESGILESDQDAWRLVFKRAEEGSALHVAAVEFLRTQSPGEYELIQKEIAS